MKNTIFGCLGAAAVAFALQFTTANVQAGLFSTCGPCDEVCNPCDDVCGTKAGKWFINGHMEAGFFANEYGQKCGTVTIDESTQYPDGGNIATHGNSNLLMNTRHTGAQGNQLYLSMGKKVDGRCGLDIGGTVDVTWGSDAWIVQANGLERTAKDPYGWGTGDYYAAFAQAYVEGEYKNWNVKAGKFYAPFGSSSYKSTDNFFYSWASTKIIAPSVGGGAYATYKVDSQLSVMGGWVTPEEFGHCTDNNFGLGGFVWTPNQQTSVKYVFAVGNECGFMTGIAGNTVYVHSVIVNRKIAKRLSYTFDWTLLDASVVHAYGLNNELVYCVNRDWSVGARFGMLSDNFITGSDWYTIGLGANWTPTPWLIVKPEIRYDWTSNPGIVAFNRFSSKDQFSGGLSAVVKF